VFSLKLSCVQFVPEELIYFENQPELSILLILFKGTVSPDYKCLEVISIKSPLLGHVTPDI
jgi:hypothetical protein